MADNLNLIKIPELIPTSELKSADRIPISQDGETRSIKGAVLEQNLLNKTDARYIENSQKGAPNGVATLDEQGEVVQPVRDVVKDSDVGIKVPSLVDGKIPNEQLKLGAIEDGNPNVVTGGDIFKKTNEKILPENFTYPPIDRPDLCNYDLIILDENNNIYKKVIFNKDTNNDIEILEIDRPDLNYALVDSNNNIINIQKEEKANFGFKELSFFKTTSDYGSFDANTDSFMNNYVELIAKYDLVLNEINNPFFKSVEKEILCTTGSSGENVYFYRIKNDNAKIKICLNAGMHAAEKMYIYGLYAMFKEIVLTPYVNQSIQWMRDNAEIVIVPCLNPTSLGWVDRKLGSRTVAETKPFKASYSSDGTKTTITFNPIDFPDENKQLDANDYFISNNTSKKRSITIQATDDDLNMPKNIYIYQVIDGNTITIPSPTANLVSGEIMIHQWADPMRNVLDTWGGYDNYKTSNTIFQLDNGVYFSRYDGMGSKPNSLQEVYNYIKLINNEDFDVVVDCHCPPRKNYISTNKNIMLPNRFNFMNEIKSFMALFNKDEFTREIDLTINEGPVFNGLPTFYTRVGNRPAFTIEWDSGLISASKSQVNEAVQFLYSVLITTIRNSVRNNKK